MTKKQKNKTIEDKDETIIEMAPIIKEKYTKLFLIISFFHKLMSLAGNPAIILLSETFFVTPLLAAIETLSPIDR